MYFDSPFVDLYLLLFYNNMGLYYERHSHRILLLLILFINAIRIYQPKKKKKNVQTMLIKPVVNALLLEEDATKVEHYKR